MRKEFLIMVENELANEDIMEYTHLIDWAYENMDNENISVFTEDDIYFMEDSGIFDIINIESDSIIGFYESGGLFENEEKIKIGIRIRTKISTDNITMGKRQQFVINELLRLLDLSIQNNKHLRFWF